MSDRNVIDEYFAFKASLVKKAEEEPEVEETEESEEKEESESSDMGSAKILNTYVAFCRALYMIHQHGHWKCKCPSFYGNHLMFQRIYEDAADRADGMAEKLIGLFDVDALDLKEQSSLICNFVNAYNTDDHIDNSLQAEKKFIEIAEKAYNAIKDNKDMSLGLDDMIMAHTSAAETSVYLLKQAKS